jgi:hypothetical protein
MSLVDKRINQPVANEKVIQEMADWVAKGHKLILASTDKPKVGEIREFAGLPLRVVRLSNLEEYIKHSPSGGSHLEIFEHFYEAEVAD